MKSQDEFSTDISKIAKSLVNDTLKRQKVTNDSNNGVLKVYSFEPDVYVFEDDFTLTRREEEETREKTKKQRKNKFNFCSGRRINVET